MFDIEEEKDPFLKTAYQKVKYYFYFERRNTIRKEKDYGFPDYFPSGNI